MFGSGFLAPFQVGHPNLKQRENGKSVSLSFAIWSIHLAKWQWSKGMEDKGMSW